MTIDGNYPKQACSEKVSGAPIVTVNVDKNGTPVANSAEVLSKTGSAILDENARSMVQGMNYIPGEAQSYVVKVLFKYDWIMKPWCFACLVYA
jgi:TonB family protein